MASGPRDLAPPGPSPVQWWYAHEVPLYLASIAVGAFIGIAAPQVSAPLGSAITPLLALLLLATFLGIPLVRLGRAVQDVRFLATLIELVALVLLVRIVPKVIR